MAPRRRPRKPEVAAKHKPRLNARGGGRLPATERVKNITYGCVVGSTPFFPFSNCWLVTLEICEFWMVT
jgi:hypothetical protein